MRYNCTEDYLLAEKKAGIQTIHEYQGFRAGDKVDLDGIKGTIRRFVKYPTIDEMQVDILPFGQKYTGIETGFRNCTLLDESEVERA